MGDLNKSVTSDSPLAGLESWLRTLIREEVRTASSQNGHHEGDLLLSAKQAAKRWDIPISWIRDMARRGELPYVKLGHYIRFSPEDLHRFIREHRK